MAPKKETINKRQIEGDLMSQECKCCTDNGRDGAKDWDETGYCQICRESGCQEANHDFNPNKCIRPPAGSPFYNPGDDAPHGWGYY